MQVKVLSKYYENFKELSNFLKITSGDFGVVRIALLNSTLSLISKGYNLNDISLSEKKSIKTIRNRISVAQQLGLVSKHKKNNVYLTELGEKFHKHNINDISYNRLTNRQISIMSSFIKENPFYSSITYSIFIIIEVVFILSKSAYPVPKVALIDYFVKSVGKTNTWQTPKARETATYIFSNYAIELEFIIKINNEFYISPKGIEAVILLQLNRSIKLLENKNW